MVYIDHHLKSSSWMTESFISKLKDSKPFQEESYLGSFYTLTQF